MKMRTLTVAELLELLEGQDPEASVIFSTCYGDYHRTQQALPITGRDIRTVTICESGYSNSGFAIVEDEDEGYDGVDADGDDEKFLVIS